MLLSEVPNAGLIVWSNKKAYSNLFVNFLIYPFLFFFKATGSIDKSLLP